VVLTVSGLVGCIVLTGVIQYFADYGSLARGPGPEDYLPVALRRDALPWIAVAGIVAFIEARRRGREAALEQARLRAEVAEQRLVALTGQLQPHFLFNTLQNISALIHRDAEAADEMLAKLSELLRDLLRHRDHVLVPLADEIRHTGTYLDIARVRFAERLAVVIDVPPDVHEALVPLFILQPLVENALAHGIGGRLDGGCISVRARRVGDRLHLEVTDDGAGFAEGRPGREGIGLANTRERLRASFGDDQHLSLVRVEAGGTSARIELPYRTAPTRA
jgi:two-component system, LytTR family, sensor kinase